MLALILGMGKDKAMLNAIVMLKEPGWGGGKAWKVIKELDLRFSPSNTITLMEMEEEIAKIKLGRNKDPETIADKLTAIQVQYDAILSDEKRAAVMIKAGCVNYASTITALCRLMQKTKG